MKRFEPAIEFQVAALYANGRELAPAAGEFLAGLADYIEYFKRGARVA